MSIHDLHTTHSPIPKEADVFGAMEPWHLIIIAVVVFALFGAKRLPDTARSVGQSLRIMRRELRTADTEIGTDTYHDQNHQNA